MSLPLKPFTVYTHLPATMFPSPEFTNINNIDTDQWYARNYHHKTALLINYHEQGLQKQ